MSFASAIGSEIMGPRSASLQSQARPEAHSEASETERFEREVDANISAVNVAVQLLIDTMLRSKRTSAEARSALEQMRYDEAKLQKVIGEASTNMTNETIRRNINSVSFRLSIAVKHANIAITKLLGLSGAENFSVQQVA